MTAIFHKTTPFEEATFFCFPKSNGYNKSRVEIADFIEQICEQFDGEQICVLIESFKANTIIDRCIPHSLEVYNLEKEPYSLLEVHGCDLDGNVEMLKGSDTLKRLQDQMHKARMHYLKAELAEEETRAKEHYKDIEKEFIAQFRSEFPENTVHEKFKLIHQIRQDAMVEALKKAKEVATRVIVLMSSKHFMRFSQSADLSTASFQGFYRSQKACVINTESLAYDIERQLYIDLKEGCLQINEYLKGQRIPMDKEGLGKVFENLVEQELISADEIADKRKAIKELIKQQFQ